MLRVKDVAAGIGPGRDYSSDFISGLLDPGIAPAGITGPRCKAATKRYNVYRNNVTVSLINALAEAFPATKRITGDDFFRAMARFHIRATPPTSPLLFEYGREFPDFIEAYEHARQMPWLADVARIECAWLDAYHAADVEALTVEALAAIAPDRLGDVRLAPHPAAQLLHSRFPAVTIFVANRSGGPVNPIPAAGPEDALVTRPGMEVTVRRLPPGAALFLTRLIDGEPLAAAACAALAETAFDLAGAIAGMIEAGVFSSIQPWDRG